MKTSTFAQTSLKGRALIAVIVTAVLVVIGVGVARAATAGDPQKIASAAASTTSDSKGATTAPAPATLEEIIEDAKKTTFYDTDQFLWEHYGMTEREFEQTYGVDDDVLDPYEAPRPSAAQGGGTPSGGTAPDGGQDGTTFATRQEYEAAKDAWKAAHPGVEDDVWEAQHPNPFDCDDHDD